MPSLSTVLVARNVLLDTSGSDNGRDVMFMALQIYPAYAEHPLTVWYVNRYSPHSYDDLIAQFLKPAEPAEYFPSKSCSEDGDPPPLSLSLSPPSLSQRMQAGYAQGSHPIIGLIYNQPRRFSILLHVAHHPEGRFNVV